MIISLTWLFLSIYFAENKHNSSADSITSFSIVQRLVKRLRRAEGLTYCPPKSLVKDLGSAKQVMIFAT